MKFRLLLTACTLLILQTAWAETLHIVTENYPPFNYWADDGKSVTGLSVDIAAEMAKRTGMEIKTDIYPWARALLLAERSSDTCVISTIRTPDRENKFRWIGPIVSDKLALFALSDSDMHLNTLADAKKYMVGTYIGSASIPILEQQGVRYDVVQTDTLNLKKIQARRIDLWVASLKTGSFEAKREGVKIKPALTFGESSDMYLACGRSMGDGSASRLSQALASMRNDGTLAALEQKYQ